MNDLFQQNIKRLLSLVSVTVFACILATGCDNITSSEKITEELPSNELLEIDSTTDLAVETTDRFYFLPPLVKKPDYSGSFDPGLSPIVEICETTDCAEIHKTYSMTEGEGSELIRIDPDDEHYIVNWHTDKTGTQIGQTYRIRVNVAGVQLGYANITMAKNGKEARNATNDEAIGLVDGRTVPIKFRIETGIVSSVEVTPSEASVAVGETQQYTAALYDLQGELITGPEIEWSSGDTEIATVDEEGLATGIAPGEVMILATSGPAAGSALLKVLDEENDNAFVTTWDTSLGSGTTVTLALAGEVDATIDWGDGTTESVNIPGPHTHDYEEDGIYTVSVTGSVTAYNSFFNSSSGETSKLLTVESWGELGFEDLSYAFSRAQNLKFVPNSSEGIEGVTNMRGMFLRARKFNSPIGDWNTEAVTDMSSMFSATKFNQSIGEWNTSSVTNMSFMFSTSFFNRSIGNWDTKFVTDMSGMFFNNSSFNQFIGNWNTAAVTDMSQMFFQARSFNQPVGNWNTAAVTDMHGMFLSANSFNQPIGDWNTAAVTNMNGTFNRANSFNQPIGEWNTAAVTNMSSMFRGATSFNQPIGKWDTSTVTLMGSMFSNAQSFNQAIDGWNTSSVTDMRLMFLNARSFNQPIGKWDTAEVSNMLRMFENADSFNRDLSGWCVSNITSKPSGFDTRADAWTLPNSRPIWGTCPQ